MSFSFVQRVLTLQPCRDVTVDGVLPLVYRQIRLLEQRLRHRCCRSHGTDCSACCLHNECPIPVLFGQSLSTDPDIIRRHQKPPLPFAFSFIVTGDSLELRVTLAGTAIRHVELFIDETQELMSSLGVVVRNVQNSGYGGLEPAAPQSDLILLSSDEVMERAGRCADDSLSLKLLSPLRLMRDGAMSRSFGVGPLIRSQMRRLSTLSAYYGDDPLALDFQLISLNSECAEILEEDFSMGVGCDSRDILRFGGVLGSGEYMGIIPEIRGLLTLGSYFNAGKGASWGMGAYRVGQAMDSV